MTVMGIDIAWAQPSVTQIKATGAAFVARYFSHDTSKNLTAAHVSAYQGAGLGTVVVWESTAGRATSGFAAGAADAQAAEVQRKAAGLPDTMPIHFAVDEDTSWASVQTYFDGVTSVLGKTRTGCYGGVKVIEGAYAYGLRYLWQTVAWSGGVWSAHATIQQRGGTVLGGSADIDYATTADYGQYPRPQENDMTPDQAKQLDDLHSMLTSIGSLTEKDAKGQPVSHGAGYYLAHIHFDALAANSKLDAAAKTLATIQTAVSAGGSADSVVAAVKKALEAWKPTITITG
ncbi:glycoside hydrolase domain-containing protein [Streptomyces sp. NPDC002092]